MASLLSEPLFEISGGGPPPNKNFYHFFVGKSEVVWRWWKISVRAVDRFSKPGELKQSHEDYLDDTFLHSEVSVIFGHSILDYTKALCRGHFDYLERLSDSLLLRIVNHLELEDVGQLGRTSRRFRQLCGSEEFWEQVVRRQCNTVSDEVASLALEVGWRSIFFTSKIQLQKLISRRRLKAEEQQEVHVSDEKAEESLDEKAKEPPDEGSVKEQTSAEESDPGVIPDLSQGTDTAAGSDVSLRCDAGSEDDLESEAGSDPIMPVPGQLLEDIKNYELEPPAKNKAQSDGRGDSSVDPDKPPI